MAERKRLEPAKGKPAPMTTFRQAFRTRFTELPDPLALWTQFGIPTDLRYLKDGLLRSRPTLTLHADELGLCLKIIPPTHQPLPPSELLKVLDGTLALLKEIGVTDTESMGRPMSRLGPDDPHPLNGYCLGALHHWANLFYTLEPKAASALSAYRDSYEELMAEFAVYVIAAYSYQQPDRYLNYSMGWWKTGALPKALPFRSGDLASRVGGASRSMRKITLIEHHHVFRVLTDPDQGDNFHRRLYKALLIHNWSNDDASLLHQIALLLELVKPGWRRPDSSDRDYEPPENRARGTARRKLRDGYVRLAESDAIVLPQVTDEGLFTEVILSADEETTDKDGEIDWSPLADRATSEMIETVELSDEEAEKPVGTRTLRSRFVEDQIRRSHYAHPMAWTQLTSADVEHLRAALQRPPQIVEMAPLLALLHASLATGRSLESLRQLRITTSDIDPVFQQDAVQYSLSRRAWHIRVLPPAWNDLPVAAEDRVVAPTLILSDCTSFGQWLERYLPDVRNGFLPVGRLTGLRRARLLEWLHDATGDTHASLSGCAQFLFGQLLQASRGDVGVASLITGVGLTHSMSVAHYAHYSSVRLATYYRQALAPLAISTIAKLPLAVDSLGVGARRVPTLASVQQLVGHLQQQISLVSSPVECANYYTAYTLLGLVVGIGLRPIIDPQVSDADTEGRIVTFTDKARTDYHRRISAMPPSLLLHMRHYADYRSVAVSAAPHWRGTKVDYLFCERLTGKQRAFRPSDFETLVSSVFGLELYALRRFARTMLAQNEAVRGEDLDAFMGHWFDRVSPHDPLSTYPMRRLLAFAEGPAEDLLKQIGFKPMRYRV